MCDTEFRHTRKMFAVQNSASSTAYLHALLRAAEPVQAGQKIFLYLDGRKNAWRVGLSGAVAPEANYR